MVCRAKICGITRLEDALLACNYGADALGFVFYAKSPRYVDPIVANEIVRQLPPFVTPVALFVDASKEEIEAVLKGSPRWCIQFHGNETKQECERFGQPYIKALRVKPDADLRAEAAVYDTASAILLDAYKPGVPGGTGEVFNWSLIPEGLTKPLILAGGLTPENVETAIAKVRPYSVDVSGGVEQAKGIKDPLKLRLFLGSVKSE